MISRGHKLNDILYVYTMEQISAFQEAATVNHKNLFKEYAIAVRVATHSKQKGFSDYINEPTLQKKRKGKIVKEDAHKLKKAFSWLLKRK